MKIVRHHNGMFARGGTWTRLDFEIIAYVTELNEYRLHKIKSAETIVDIGANIGAFGVIAHRMFPQATILCVEPFSENFELLEKNAGSFAILERMAIAYGTESVTLKILAHDIGLSAASISGQSDSVHADAKWQPLEDVPACTLSSLLDKHAMRGQIDILKLDCEGAELGIIEQDESLHRVKRIVGEWHSQEVLERITARLNGLGWSIETTNYGHIAGHLFADNPHL